MGELGIEELRTLRRRLDATRALALRLQEMCAGEQAGEELQVMRATVWRALALSYRQAVGGDDHGLVDGLDDTDRATHESILASGESYAAGRAPSPLSTQTHEDERAAAVAHVCDQLLAAVDAERLRGDTMATVLAAQPDILERLDEMHQAAWSIVDPIVLELCRLRIATLLGCEVEQQVRSEPAIAAGLDEATIAELAAWPRSERFGPRERACLAFCEQFVIDVAGMNDDTALAVSTELGPHAFRAFVAGLLVVEQRQRLRLAWQRLLDQEPAP